MAGLHAITVEISHFKDFEFKYYDRVFLDYKRIMYYFKDSVKSTDKRRIGIVYDIDMENGTITIVSSENTINALKSMKLKVHLSRDSHGKLYAFSKSSRYISTDLRNIDMELMKFIYEENNNG